MEIRGVFGDKTGRCEKLTLGAENAKEELFLSRICRLLQNDDMRMEIYGEDQVQTWRTPGALEREDDDE